MFSIVSKGGKAAWFYLISDVRVYMALSPQEETEDITYSILSENTKGETVSIPIFFLRKKFPKGVRK